MATTSGPGSVISIGSDTDPDVTPPSKKRQITDQGDSDEEEGEITAESPGSEGSPSSRLAAVGRTRTNPKASKRRKTAHPSAEEPSSEDDSYDPVPDPESLLRRADKMTGAQPQRMKSPPAVSGKGRSRSKQHDLKAVPQAAIADSQTEWKDKKGKIWTLPPLVTEGTQSNTRSERVKVWCRQLLDLNPANVSSIKASVVVNVFGAYMRLMHKRGNTRSNFKKEVKKLSKTGELDRIIGINAPSNGKLPSSEDMTAALDLSGVEETGHARPAQEGSSSGDTHQFSSLSATDHMRLQSRYFPSTGTTTRMCLRCGRAGHSDTECPRACCKHCNHTSHADFVCPTRARCSKCRQLGHQPTHCKEKLALTKDEGLVCSLCGLADHLENDCTEFWRSFHPEESTIHTVAAIAPTCSLCGSEGDHFASDCHEGQHLPINPTWTMRNHSRYVDPQSETQSIEGNNTTSSQGVRAFGVPEHRIKGRATHVQYESEDSETEFLAHPPVKGRPPIGQIRVASNIQMPNIAGRAGGYQPPLPPGPPPSMPPPSWQGDHYHPPPPVPPHRPSVFGSDVPPPPSSLPARPPLSNHQYFPPPADYTPSAPSQSSWAPNGQGYMNEQAQRPAPPGPRVLGRGGRGGRGRGRGRGGTR